MKYFQRFGMAFKGYKIDFNIRMKKLIKYLAVLLDNLNRITAI